MDLRDALGRMSAELISAIKLLRVTLDGLELVKRADVMGTFVVEIRSIHNLSISGKRRIVELQIPGSTGNVFQDMGRNPLRISFDGVLLGIGANTTMQELKSKFELKRPVRFSSNIPVLSDVTEVIIESLEMDFVGGEFLESRYSIVLREHKSSATGLGRGPGETEPPSQEDRATNEIRQRIKGISNEFK